MIENNQSSEWFSENYRKLSEIYKIIFNDTLKNRALVVWLSPQEWEDLIRKNFFDQYTDFFLRMQEELYNRAKNNYFDVSDLMNPSTKNLEFQITDNVIKKAYIEKLLYEKTDLINWYASKGPLKLYQLYHDIKLREEYKKDYPIDHFKSLISIEYDEKILEDVYENLVSEVVWNKEIDTMLDIALDITISCWFAYDVFYSELLWNFDDIKNLFSVFKKYSDIFCDWLHYFLEYDQSWNKNNLELLLLKIFDNYKESIFKDSIVSDLYLRYFISKMRFYYQRLHWFMSKRYTDWTEYQDWIYEIYTNHKDMQFFSELFLTKDKISELINYFPDWNQRELLLIYSLIYFDILDRTDRENYIKELLYRMKKLSGDESLIVNWLREYLTALLRTTFLMDFKWEKRPWYFDEISGDLRYVFWDEEFLEFESIFKKTPYANKWDEKVRSHYRIWLIFGDSRSKKAFDLYCNDKRNDSEFEKRQIKKSQFDILAEEYYDQQNLDIERKLEKWKLSFVLIFEMDHETKLRNLLKLYPDRLIICDVPKQHFSHMQFLKMLDLGLKNYEN